LISGYEAQHSPSLIVVRKQTILAANDGVMLAKLRCDRLGDCATGYDEPGQSAFCRPVHVHKAGAGPHVLQGLLKL
jgi:hypothetical protein